MMLEVDNVSKFFGGVRGLDRCSFKVKKGLITALIGPNGSGKSTVFNVISRLTAEDSGGVFFEGKSLAGMKSFEVAGLGVSRTFQETRLFYNLTVRQNLETALETSDRSLFRSVFGKKQSHEKRVREVLGFLQLEKVVNSYASDLSYGQRKLLDLGMAVAKPHKMLLLDEPVEGVNPLLRKRIKKAVKSLNKEGETVLLIEHDMNFVMGLADHVIVLSGGRVIAEGPPEKIQKNKKVLESYLGE